ncbi:MAG: flagellar basal body rod protein [Thermobacillus sp. ZCTH02-B1]|uniref:flagellar hook-basal body protein n=1 Tax=Thermobacillus sp. ZCTH02-B1 TaxID=1858795 RepID=UPI000B57179F|nr:flagellar hook-basal body protein [Thermobacillus sp. ZCTH02-B1]OUM94944.1 MAG: flagellar basal body rod protein [Thermobacillus sp. ZCTH02-B1]
MLRGLYTAAAGMIAQQRRHDTVTNNISNLNTPGYKEAVSVNRSFPEMLLRLTGLEGQKPRRIGAVNTGVFAEESLSVHVQGDLYGTGRMSDFAIRSEIGVPGLVFDGSGKAVDANGNVVFRPQAFFTVQNPDGAVRYTRNGAFLVNEEGYLVTNDGSFVLGTDNNPVRFPPGVAVEELTLTDDFRFVDATGADTGAQLLITVIENPNRLVREGYGKFRLNDEDADLARPAAAGDNIEVRQGHLERANVDAAQAMVDLMSALRAYESNQRVIQFYDSTLNKAVNEVGKV